MSNKIEDIDIKNRTYYFFSGIHIYYIRYLKIKDLKYSKLI